MGTTYHLWLISDPSPAALAGVCAGCNRMEPSFSRKCKDWNLLKSMPVWLKYWFRRAPKLWLTTGLRSHQVGAATVSVQTLWAVLCACITSIKKLIEAERRGHVHGRK